MGRVPLPEGLAQFNRRVTNPLLGRVAGKAGPLVMVEHRGRRSGRAYKTPVVAFPQEDGWVIPLTYGTGRDWVRNLQAAGGGDLVVRGERVRVVDPRIVPTESVTLPRPVCKVLATIKAPDVMLLRSA